MKNYDLDPVYYYTAPGLAWDSSLKITGIRLDLLSDPRSSKYVGDVWKRYQKNFADIRTTEAPKFCRFFVWRESSQFDCQNLRNFADFGKFRLHFFCTVLYLVLNEEKRKKGNKKEKLTESLHLTVIIAVIIRRSNDNMTETKITAESTKLL